MAIKPVSRAQQEPPAHHVQVNLPPAPTGKVPPPTMESPQPSTTNQRGLPDEDQRSVTPLSEISQLLRLQKYHKRRCHQAESHLHCLQIAAARTSRLVRLSRSVQYTLAECVRSEDKNSFVNLLHAFHDACDEALKPTPDREFETTKSTTSFLGDLSPSSRTAVLDLFSKLRHDESFIANRLASLSPKELVALLPERTNTRATESIFGGGPRISSRTSKPLGFVVDAQVDQLSTYGYSSPLETLVFASRGLNRNDLQEDERSTDIWACVCARLVSEQKSGSERLIPAVLDIWSSSMPWPGKDRLEVWILQTLQNGAFLLEQPTKPTFRARIEGRSDVSPEEEQRTEVFYSNAVDSLLELLGDQSGPSILPPGALKMCRAIWSKLSSSPGHQHAFPQFVLVRWLFSSFVSNAVTLPESHGLFTDYYLSDNARNRILREVATRAQKAAFDVAYSWRHGIAAAAETVQRVNNLMVRFQGSRTSKPSKSTHSRSAKPQDSDIFVAISAKDVISTLNALYPQRRPASVSSDGDNLKSGLQSSASSISGFSLFSQAKALEPHSEMPSPSLQDTQSFGSVETAIANLEVENSSLDSAHMREVCLELEDLVTSRSSTRDIWDVLTANGQESPLCTLRSKLTHVCSLSKGLRDGSVTPSGDTVLMSLSKAHTSCRRAVEVLLQRIEASELSSLSPGPTDALEEAERDLEILFEDTIQESEDCGDFVKAHTWFQQFQDFQSLIFRTANMTPLRDLLAEIELNARKSIKRALKMEDTCETWTQTLSTLQQLHSEALKPLLDEHERLRDKMWYVADVRTSAPYDEARSIASALRVMGKPKRLSRTRLSPPLRHWSATKLSSTNMHLKTEAQILEILSAKPDHGGPNKLSDDQSKTTQLWMDRQNIDNLCKGEERLHKLCMEIRKCVDQVVATPAEGSTLWQNTLFARDAAFRQQQIAQRKPSLLAGLSGTMGSHGMLSLSGQLRSTDGLSSASHTLSNASSRDYLDSRSPTLASKSSMPFWSPAMTEVDSPSSATSIGDSHTQSALESVAQKLPVTSSIADQPSLERLRHRATSLVLSDLTSTMFTDGSETDHAYWSGLGRDLTERHFRGLYAVHASIGSQTPTMDSNAPPRPIISRFSFDSAFKTLLQKFSAISNPSTKLGCLYDIDRLLVPYMAEQAANESPSLSFTRSNSEMGQLVQERRSNGLAETSVAGFRNVFSKSTLRPTTIFRDLQYIAALLPSSILHNTPEGKAFCNAAVAITSLKQEARTIMVETADSIIAYHSNNRGHGRSSSTAQQQRDSATFAAPSRTPSAEEVSRYSMADAAYLLQITAKEGDPVAQRELATLYLTHPELMDRIIAPFARTRDVFKEELESKWRKNQDPNRCDPTTMCVAHHWMSLSSKGGDSLAKEILRQREEMDSF
ncbi:hypothetical protein PRZ48_007558 [Zasmidium cellare]|uniref:Uncharacterized protein n=1 Tax=Zasmidium cellare TaxID=395010 RepID=A0ABR0EK26_ZASCE|nr:hypothetical protein PRZ48_007558 [Zasmidium cellare]